MSSDKNIEEALIGTTPVLFLSVFIHFCRFLLTQGLDGQLTDCLFIFKFGSKYIIILICQTLIKKIPVNFFSLKLYT